MRYLILTYIKKPNGQIDEVMELSKRLRNKDLACASVILDFKTLKVEKASMGGVTVPRDFNRIVEYYHQHYAKTIERLFKENGYDIVKPEEPKPTADSANEK